MEKEKRSNCKYAKPEIQSRISVRLTKETKSKFDKVVQTTYKSKTDYIREWIDFEYNRLPK